MKSEQQVRRQLELMLGLDMTSSMEGACIKTAVCRALLWTLGEENEQGGRSLWTIPANSVKKPIRRVEHG